MRNSPPNAAGRILTLFSIVFLVALSFIVVFSDSKRSRSIFLYRRGQKSGTSATPVIATTQAIPTPSPSHSSSSDTQPLTPSSKPTPTQASTSASDNPTSAPLTSAQTSSDASTTSESSTPTLATDATTTSQVSSDSATVSSSAATSTSPIQSSNTPFITYGTSLPSTTIIPMVTNQATVMQTGTALPLPTTTISASGAPANSATSTGFFANKGAVAGTFTVVTLFAIVLLFMGYNFIARRRRHARYRREDEEAYFEKAAQQHGEPGDSGLDEADASMTNAMTPASADAYPDRQVHFGTAAPQGPEVTYTPQDYGIDYPPGTNYHQTEFQYGANINHDTQRVYRQSSPGSPAPIANRDRTERDPFYNTAGRSQAI